MMGSVPSGPRSPVMDLFGLSDPPDNSQSEDCLVLNVWTPGIADGGRRPVLFRIHGGGYGAGSGSWNWHNGTNLARRGDVVVVTVNHRLSPLGYLYLDEIGGAGYAGAGNAGMLDLVLALKWVRDNIEAFGGDPNRVMIFGESGGGSKVSTLLAMPDAAGLFHAAVVQSGPGLRAKTPPDASQVAEQYLAELEIGNNESTAWRACRPSGSSMPTCRWPPSRAIPWRPWGFCPRWLTGMFFRTIRVMRSQPAHPHRSRCSSAPRATK